MSDALSETHLTSTLKAGIVADPDRFVDLDPGIVATLLDQRSAGKQLLLITNSDWAYTRQIMAYAFDCYCPGKTTWRDLFDIVIVSANKPGFFAKTDPIYRVVDEDESLLKPHHGSLEPGNVYFGGNARLVEASLGTNGYPLYVGDHLFGDVHVTKDVLRWRTALIARELEAEISDATGFAARQRELEALMDEKIDAERRQAVLRLNRSDNNDGDNNDRDNDGDDNDRDDNGSDGRDAGRAKQKELSAITARLFELDDRIAPIARAAGELGNPIWGPLMRAGNDKSLFARQVERYADVYTSRVSNLRYETPYAYLRAARGSLPHDAASRH